MASGSYAHTKTALTVTVEGVIGVGKTTLAEALTQYMGAVPYLEDYLANPFLKRFYKNRERYAFICQQYFLESRVRQFVQGGHDGLPIVSDHSMLKDRIFAQINLSDEEHELYMRYYKRLTALPLFESNVTIFLSASLEEVMERIRKRGHKMEFGIEASYLGQLVDAYQEWMLSDEASKKRVVVVNVDAENIAENPKALERLVESCQDAPLGMSYCNPM